MLNAAHDATHSSQCMQTSSVRLYSDSVYKNVMLIIFDFLNLEANTIIHSYTPGIRGRRCRIQPIEFGF